MRTTTLYAALLTLLYLYLTYKVIRERYRHQQLLGAEPQQDRLQRAIRAHGNFIEYTPLFLILLYLLESKGHEALSLWLGGLFLIARCSHAYSLLVNEPKAIAAKSGLIRLLSFRSPGMVLTLGTMIVAAIILLMSVV